MEVSQNSGIQADSTAQIGTLILSRTTLDFGGADAFRVDSSRIQARKPVAPVIKTVPYIPENDSISHPVYDVLNGEFVITNDESLISHLRLNPIEPVSSDTEAIQAVEPQRFSMAAKQSNTEVLRQAKSTPESEVLAEGKPSEAISTDTIPAADSISIAADTLAVADTVTTADTTIIVDTAPKQEATYKIYEEKEGKPLMRKTYGFSLDKSTTDTDWMIGVIIASFLFFAWIRMIYGKYVGMAFQSAANFFAANRTYTESNAVRSRVFFLLNILFYINISLFSCQCLNFFGFNFDDYSGLKLFGACMLSFFAVYSVRTIILKFLDFVFDTESFGYYNFSIYLYCKIYGLILLPLIAVIPFVPDFVTEKLIWAGLAAFVLMYILTLFRGFRICLRKGVSIFYLFFYLCALEILPLLTVYKYVLKYLL
jgi:hypothetical protein